MRKLAKARRKGGIDTRTNHLRQNRSTAFRTNRNRQRRTVDDGGRQEIAKGWTVNDIDRNLLGLDHGSNGAILRFIAGRHENKLCALDMFRRKGAAICSAPWLAMKSAR